MKMYADFILRIQQSERMSRRKGDFRFPTITEVFRNATLSVGA